MTCRFRPRLRRIPLAAVFPSRRSAVPLSHVFMRAGWQKGGNTRAGVMARISALDLEQRFSMKDENSIRKK